MSIFFQKNGYRVFLFKNDLFSHQKKKKNNLLNFFSFRKKKARKNSHQPNFVKWSVKVKLQIKRKAKEQNVKKLQKILDSVFKAEKFFMSREMKKEKIFSFFFEISKREMSLFEISKSIFIKDQRKVKELLQ